MEKENMLQTQQNEVKLRVNEAKDQKVTLKCICNVIIIRVDDVSDMYMTYL